MFIRSLDKYGVRVVELTDYSRNEVAQAGGGRHATDRGERVRDIGARAPQQTAYWTCYVGVCAAMYQHKHRYVYLYTYISVYLTKGARDKLLYAHKVTLNNYFVRDMYPPDIFLFIDIFL